MSSRASLIGTLHRDQKDWRNFGIIIAVLVISAVIAYRLSIAPVRTSTQVIYFFAALALMVFSIVALRSMSLALTVLVCLAALVEFGIDTGTNSKITLAIIIVTVLTLVWLMRMLVFERRMYFVPSSLNFPMFAFLLAALVSWLVSFANINWRILLPKNLLVVQLGQFSMFALSAAALWLGANHPLSRKTLQFWTIAISLIGFSSIAYEGIFNRVFPLKGVEGGMLMWPIVFIVSQFLFNPKFDQRLRILGLAALGVWGLWIMRWAWDYKGDWVPAALAIAFMIFLKNKRLGVILGVLGSAVFFLTNFLNIFLQGEASSLLRPLIWWDVIRLGSQAPVFGLGPVIYMYLWKDPSFTSITFQQAHVYAWTRATFAPPSHNLYVDIFAQTGVVGTFFFLWLLVAAVQFGWRFHKRFSPGFDSAYVHAVFAGFVAMAISSAPFADWLIPFVYNIGIGGFSQSVYTWLLFGTLVALDHNYKSRPDGE